MGQSLKILRGASIVLIIVLTMHTFLTKVVMLGSSKAKTVEKVKELLKKCIESDFKNDSKILKNEMDKALGNILGSEKNIFGKESLFHLWIDAMWKSATPEKKSFFINIMVKGKGHIVITAEHWELKTLRDMAAKEVAKRLEHEDDVEKLCFEIPKCLFE